MMEESEVCFEETFEFIKNLTLEGGIIMRDGFYRTKIVQTKDGVSNDLVTEYDSRLENMFITRILAKYPTHKFIGEETSAQNHFTPDLTEELTWFIDPIDGTTNFINKIPITAISIGLSYKKEIVIGIIYNPISNEMYTAQKGKGAFLNGAPILANKAKTIKECVLGVEAIFFFYKYQEKFINGNFAELKNLKGIRSLGCAAISLAYVAQGLLEAFHVESLKPWDLAAGELMVREAGGFVYSANGETFDVMKGNIVCAGTRELCEELINIYK